MARLDHPDYLAHLRRESQRFRVVLADCDPAARVPGCPAWDASDLLWHLAEVQNFWATIVRGRPSGPAQGNEPPRPSSYDDQLAAFDRWSAELVAALSEADPTQKAWTWSSEQTVGFTFRRQAHEALIHRLDAEQTAGTLTPLDPTLAADGVDEALDIMFGGSPPWGVFAPLPHFLRVDLTDTGESVWVQLGRFTGTNPVDDVAFDEDDLRVVDVDGLPPDTEPDAVISGPAGAVDAWLWRRGDAEALHVTGDRGVYDRFRLAVDHPID